ncbi:MAG: hypothetical protein HP008_00130 [Clostridia bacterium]|nr:hypothetical protein [Clostridia bacterium]
MDGGLIKSLLNGLFTGGGDKSGGKNQPGGGTPQKSSLFSGGILKNLLSDPEKTKNLINAFGNFTSGNQSAHTTDKPSETPRKALVKSKSYVDFSDNPLISVYLKSGTVVKHETITTKNKPIKI